MPEEPSPKFQGNEVSHPGHKTHRKECPATGSAEEKPRKGPKERPAVADPEREKSYEKPGNAVGKTTKEKGKFPLFSPFQHQGGKDLQGSTENRQGKEEGVEKVSKAQSVGKPGNRSTGGDVDENNAEDNT